MKLTTAGYDVGSIQGAAFRANGEKKIDPLKSVRRWTSLPNATIIDGLFNEARDVSLLQIEQEVLTVLKPWIETKTDECLPDLQVLQLSRATGMSPERIIDTLSRFPLSISVNGLTFSSVVQIPDMPKDKLTLSRSTEFAVSPKRVIKDARYLSRPPGGGSVQKARVQESKIDGIIRKEARRKAKVVFKPIQEIDKSETISPKEKGKYMYYVWQEIAKMQITNPEYPDVSLARLTTARETSVPVTLFIPWGVRPEGKFGSSEIAVLDKLKLLQDVLKGKGIPVDILIMPADLYATEVNNQVDGGQTSIYFEQVAEVAKTEFDFNVKPWSEIRLENWETYQTRSNQLTVEKIDELLTNRKISEAIGAATRRSGYSSQEDIMKAAYAYLRERICEAEIIESQYKPIKVSCVPKNKDNEIDINLPRLYIIPYEQQLPWLK